jgi:uncharacterized membrane protein YgaE (UPF0421/DUF939 family)
VQVVKTAVAVVVAWGAAQLLLGEPLPVFAAIAALLVVQPSVNQSLGKGIERSLGVIVGVVLAFGAAFLFGETSWIVLGIIVVALVLAWLLKLTPGSANQIPISAMLVLAIGAGDTTHYAVERIVETIIGTGVALIVNFAIVPPVALVPSRNAVLGLADDVAQVLDGLADALSMSDARQHLRELIAKARELRTSQSTAREKLERAQESLLLNPRSGKHRAAVDWDQSLLDRLSVLVTRVLGMTRALRDNHDDTLVGEPIVSSIAAELRRAAHDLRLIADPNRSAGDETVTADLPLLTAPLSVAAPHPQHWILIGSLLEDLRRVREEILEALPER